MFDQRDTDPIVLETARKLALVREAAPQDFARLQAMIDAAVGRLYPPMKLTGDLAKTATALGLTADDSQQVAILSARREREAAAVAAVPEEGGRRKFLRAFFGDHPALGEFLSSRDGTTP